jgi:transposase
MLRQMERSTIQLLAKRGKSQRAIARELGVSRVTVARALQEPVDKAPATRHRRSLADPFVDQIKQWLSEKLSIVRMLELARSDPDHPYAGRISVFGDAVRRIRRELAEKQADVPIRFEGLPAEYLQVDWGEIRRFPFTQQPPATRYFLACRLKYSRWSWVWWTCDMRQETLLRGLVACFGALGWVPWVLTFDNMKTVTSGRDPTNQPLWTPALLQLAAAFDFHPEACAIGAANQKGSVESLVKWVKGNFLAGRLFADDVDLAHQNADWLAASNARPSAATGERPLDRLGVEAAKGGMLPRAAHDYALLDSGHVTAESLVPLCGNVYSVPLGHVGAAVTIRRHAERVRIWRDTTCLADHPRAPDGAHKRIIDPAHFADLFGRKARAQVMLYRTALLELGDGAASYVGEVSRRRRDKLREEILALYGLGEAHGAGRLLAAMSQAKQVGAFGAEYIRALLEGGPPADIIPGRLTLFVPGVPRQEEIDRLLSSYEVYVEGCAVAVGGDAR